MRDAFPACDKERPGAVFAAAAAEVFRPLCVRWGSDAVRDVYERTMAQLWAGTKAGSNASALLQAVKQLPEAAFDDSHHRDYYVMLALGVLYYAARLVIGDGSASDAHSDMDELDAVLDHLANLLDVSACVDELRRSKAASGDETMHMRQAAAGCAPTINEALDAVARANGWSPDRVRP
jgi:hypothetical protein